MLFCVSSLGRKGRERDMAWLFILILVVAIFAFAGKFIAVAAAIFLLGAGFAILGFDMQWMSELSGPVMRGAGFLLFAGLAYGIIRLVFGNHG